MSTPEAAPMSARQAAAYCGVSDKTIRRWITTGRLAAARDGHDFRITREALDLVRGPRRTEAAPDAAAAADSRADIAADPAAPGAAAAAQGAALVELVARQEQTIMELAGRVGWLQAELQQRDEQLKALQAPKLEPETDTTPVSVSPVDQAEQAERNEPLPSTPEPHRVPWPRRAWAWLTAAQW